MKRQLEKLLQERCENFVSTPRRFIEAERKSMLMAKRNAEIVRCKAKSKVHTKRTMRHEEEYHYRVSYQFLVKQGELMYLEEEAAERIAYFYKGVLVSDDPAERKKVRDHTEPLVFTDDARRSYVYDRLEAVKYADTWWNEYNPAYRSFENDCTNYISQCLHAGGGPMRGAPNRSSGWWYSGNSWSYSWTVAHALQLYLQNSTVGLRGREVSSPYELEIGDIICYDFEGDGRFNHNTIITAKDYYGNPLVNAHTTDSRHRYWSYEDSSAYTPNIRYRFYAIEDDA
ncbi:MAG: amidase domain-containing protein [Bacillus sp. (in: firmicutes)]